MPKRFLLLAVAWQLSLLARAQNPADSMLRLEEVVIYTIPEQKFATGSKIIRFDSAELTHQLSRSLSDLLIRKTPVYLKEYGPGMVSSISFRGTGASHTAVLWNGLNINQPNLGQTDFSLIPLFAIENISVQFGGSSALYGSDAIGGTIHLSSEPQWQDRLSLKVQQELGSFGRDFTGAAASSGLRNWSFTSKLYRLQSDNDFEYINTQKRARPKERNRNAAFEQKGVVQDVAYRFSGSSYLSLKSWYQHTKRQVQPTMINKNTNDRQEDKNLNLSLQYRKNGPSGFFDAQLGYLYNYLLYHVSSGNSTNIYRTRQYVGNLRYEKSVSELWHFQIGHKTNYIRAAIKQYPEGKGNEVRSDFFASTRFRPSEHFTASLNLRQAFVTGYTVPFTPSAGLEYVLFSGKSSSLNWLASGGRSYRVPTLNDRYYANSGNPNLKPENSWNIDSGLRYSLQKQKKRIDLSATGYYMWVDNWILWQPAGLYWVPLNIQEVHSKGLEVEGSLSQPLAAGVLETGGTFALTRSINKKAKIENDRTVDKQLPFVPKIKYNLYLNYELNSWLLRTNWSYVGTRHTTGEEIPEYSLPPFYLFDCAFGKTFRFNQHNINLQLEVRNLFNKQYQNYENRAMPGRSLNFTAKYHFTQPN